jgi:hypothetical protein
MLLRSLFFAVFICLFARQLVAQTAGFSRLNVPATVNGQALAYPFAGGLNNPQFSAADLNNDGIQDLVAFDRGGDIVLTFLNLGTPGEVSYTFAPEYAAHFPKMVDYALLRDFNQDGAADIFCSSIAPGTQEVQVFRGHYEDNVLKFSPFLFTYPASCTYCNPLYVFFPSEFMPGQWINMPIAKSDVPAVDDVDNDGDLDIVAFSAGTSTHLWWLKNVSVEMGYGLDSLQFRLADDCWGRFYENGMERCRASLSVNPNICDDGLLSVASEERDNLHPGAAVTTFDQDQDGDRDLLLGNLSFPCIGLMNNGGTPQQAWMTAQDTAFPAYNTPVNIEVFPATFILDVNNDGKKDLLVSPNNKTVSQDQKNVWFYTNTASNGYQFALTTKSLFTDEMIDVGSASHPAFADVNADGLLDLVVGNYGYFLPQDPVNASLYLYLNTGTPTQPQFALSNNDWLGLSEFTPDDYDFAPTFGDLDSDGDLDLVVGSNIGSCYYYRNIAGPGLPMNFQRDFDPMWVALDVIGSVSTPFIYDLDGDGLQDLLMGERTGNVNFFQNIGTPTAPAFAASPTISKIGAIDTRTFPEVVGFSAPVVVPTEAGPMAVVGTQGGQLEAYVLLGATSDTFPTISLAWGGLDEGNRSSPAFADLDDDGFFDVAIGNLRGGISIFKTPIADPSVATAEPAALLPSLRLSPNPAQDWVRAEWLPNEATQWRAFDALGQQVAAGSTAGGVFHLEIKNWKSGFYVVETIAGGQRAAARLVKI